MTERLDPAGDAASQVRKCYILGRRNEDGIQVATSDTGEKITVFKHPA